LNCAIYSASLKVQTFCLFFLGWNVNLGIILMPTSRNEESWKPNVFGYW